MTKLFNFKRKEFTCKCGCGQNFIQDRFLIKLDKARQISKVPYIITSGYRCDKHNKDVGGVKNSAHTKGLACDIRYSNNNELFCIIKGLIGVGFLRILIYPKKKFVHVDMASYLPVRILKIME